MQPPQDLVIAETKAWFTRAVIGLNLCPFAAAVHARHQIRWVATDVVDTATLLQVLKSELQVLSAARPEDIETTLIIHPGVLGDFLEFNEFLAEADEALEELGFVGVIQIASFHPQFQFAGTDADDITNATNRSPFPTLHLLREKSVEVALEGFDRPESIYETNIETMRRLGPDGWERIQKEYREAAQGMRDDRPEPTGSHSQTNPRAGSPNGKGPPDEATPQK